MCRYVGFFICIFLFSCSSNIKENKKAALADTEQELVILGTIHQPTDLVNPDSMFNILEAFSPDVIMLEADSSIFDDDFIFTETWGSNENIAILKYVKIHPEVAVRPIEFEGRNDYRFQNGLDPGANQVFGLLYELAEGKKLNKKQQNIWNNFIELSKQRDHITDQTLKSMNAPSSDELFEKHHQRQTKNYGRTRRFNFYKKLFRQVDSV